MKIINSNDIINLTYQLCLEANTQIPQDIYEIIYKKYKTTTKKQQKEKLYNILKNIEIASKTQRPLCQDTGQVIVFVEIGTKIETEIDDIEKAINSGIEKAYKECFFRKSVVKNALFDRTNTNTNTPAIIYTKITNSNKITIELTVKGAGSENYCKTNMFKPTSKKEEIFDFVKNCIKDAGEKACPPLVIGIGVGGTMDKAAVLSKQAFNEIKNTKEEKDFITDLKNYLSDINDEILDIKIATTSTHIASLPVAVTINCHCFRHAKGTIENEKVTYENKTTKVKNIPNISTELKKIKTNEIEKIKDLKAGETFLLTGEIYTARDAAHEKLLKIYLENKKLPLNLKDKIIFYAGPCPAAPNEVIGPIGPTTSARMDKFCEFMYSNGLLATIGKGERAQQAINEIKKHKGKYFTAQGGIACLLAKCVKSSETILFDELGTEAIRKLYVEDFPLKVEI